MSDIKGNLGKTGPDGTSQNDVVPFPYRIVTDYVNKLMSVTISGNWSGSVDDSGIVVSTDTVSSPGNSIISFIFTNATPGAATSVLLTNNSDTPSISYSLALDFVG
jgi:hypothetical protein